jgi:hypothetical protein
MIAAIFACFRLLFLLFDGHRAVALENIALRHQLAILSRNVAHPRLHQRDRLFWVWLSKVWRPWKTALVIVQPETVVRSQRNRFRRYWRQLSRPENSGGRPAISSKIGRWDGEDGAWANHRDPGGGRSASSLRAPRGVTGSFNTSQPFFDTRQNQVRVLIFPALSPQNPRSRSFADYVFTSNRGFNHGETRSRIA